MLTLNGSGFVQSSQVQWNGNSLAIVYQTATKLQATVPARDIATAGTASVTVFNPTPGGGTSAPQTITINNPVPFTISLSPSSATIGGAAFTLTINGSNFVGASQVYWNNIILVIVSQNATQIQATVPTADITAIGTASVTVVNLAPGGGTSNPQTFTITKITPPINWSPVGHHLRHRAERNPTRCQFDRSRNFVYSPAAGTVPIAGVQTLSATFTPTDSAHYATVRRKPVTVNQATPNCAWPAPAAIIYPTALTSHPVGRNMLLDCNGTLMPVPGTYRLYARFGRGSVPRTADACPSPSLPRIPRINNSHHNHPDRGRPVGGDYLAHAGHNAALAPP